ncbi:MAG: hypothetical protein QME58_06950 [Bacteroidota bacterium]|nr:hypothetical protein [Bacteroidota bacterium]
MKRMFICLLLFPAVLFSQQNAEPKFGINFSGFVKTDIFYDTRQTTSLREGHFALYPADELLDKTGADINAKSNFNILSIQTRLLGKITAPDAFDAKTSGLIEGEFFGTSDGDANGFRLRHAYVNLDWEKLSLLIGQTWHPMFVTEVFPGVVSFNTGVPFQPFSRNPQLRLTVKFGPFSIQGAALAQRDFQSFGPKSSSDGAAGQCSSFLRNSGSPNLNLQTYYKLNDNVAGIGVDYKKLTPRLATSKNFKTNETISNRAINVFAKMSHSGFTLKTNAVYGENLADLMMLGGYAAVRIDTVTDLQEYANLSSYSMWGDLTYGKEIEFGLFAGMTKNLGATENITNKIYGRGENIDNVIRISPRVQWTSGKTKIATELEYTTAAYGKIVHDKKAIIEQAHVVSNLRILVAAFYYF